MGSARFHRAVRVGAAHSPDLGPELAGQEAVVGAARLR